MNSLRRFSILMFATWVTFTVGEALWRLASSEPVPILGLYAAIPLWLFGVSHLVVTKGTREGLIFAGLALVLGGGLEYLGLSTGLDQYSDMLGPKIGPLPLVIPFAWLGSLYPAYILVNSLAGQATVQRIRQLFGLARGIGWALFLTLATAVMATTYDLGLDPPMVAAGVWTYQIPGPFYDVPFQNFLGWLIIVGVVVLPIRLRELSHPPTPPRTWFENLPLAAFAGYLAAAFFDNLLMGLPVPAMLVLMAQGGGLLAALTVLIAPRVAPSSQSGSTEHRTA